MEKFKKKTGQAIVEFAIIAPILLMLIFGIVDFSRLIYHNILIADASREGLRLASVGNDIGSVSNKIKNIVRPITGESTPTVIQSVDKNGKACTKITVSSTTDSIVETYITPTYTNTLSTGTEITFSTMYTYKFITPIGFIFHNIVSLESSYSTRVESPPK